MPIVNLNGDRHATLEEQAQGVYAASGALIAALKFAAPHGRNYQCNPPGEGYEKARAEFEDLCASALKVRRYYEAVLFGLDDQRRK
jgi:hypothetical protein